MVLTFLRLPGMGSRQAPADPPLGHFYVVVASAHLSSGYSFLAAAIPGHESNRHRRATVRANCTISQTAHNVRPISCARGVNVNAWKYRASSGESSHTTPLCLAVAELLIRHRRCPGREACWPANGARPGKRHKETIRDSAFH
jgi:hypothetical protein